MTPHAYVPGLGDYCSRCNADKANRRFHPNGDAAPLDDPFDLPSDVELINAGIQHCLESGMQRFSANDMRHWLDRVTNGRAVTGPTFAKWKRAKLIVEVDHVASTQAKTKHKVVAVYAPGPNWLAKQKENSI